MAQPLPSRSFAVVALVLLLWACAFAPTEPTATPPKVAACVGVNVTPADDLAALARGNPEGTTFCLAPGEYRNQSVRPRARQRFVGVPGQTVLSGAVSLERPVRDGALWVYTGRTEQGQVVGECAPERPACKYPEDLFLGGQALQRVLSLPEVAPGKWFFDLAADRVYLSDDPAGKRVELSSTRVAFYAPPVRDANGKMLPDPSVGGVVLEGLTIEKYAIPGHFFAIGDQYPAPGWTIRRCEVRFNHGGGVGLNGGVIEDSFVHHNGQQGVGGTGANNVVQRNEIAFNNFAGFDAGWEAGGGKFASTTNLVYRQNYTHDNDGPGAWTDIDNRGAQILDNRIEGNDGPGIMHEISYDATVRGNRLANNGKRGDYVYSAEILVSSSRNVLIEGNTVTVGATSGARDALPLTRMGIVVFQGTRTGGNCDTLPCASSGNVVRDNTVTYSARLNYLGGGAGLSGSGVFSSGSSSLLADNRFERNRYRAPDCTGARWSWVTPGAGAGTAGRGSLEDAQRLGLEAGSTCTP
jgi:hypothetical protein